VPWAGIIGKHTSDLNNLHYRGNKNYMATQTLYHLFDHNAGNL